MQRVHVSALGPATTYPIATEVRFDGVLLQRATAERRFSEFVAFYRRMESCYVGKWLGKGVKLPAMPPKHVFSQGGAKRDPRFIEQRRAAIEACLNGFTRVPRALPPQRRRAGGRAGRHLDQAVAELLHHLRLRRIEDAQRRAGAGPGG